MTDLQQKIDDARVEGWELDTLQGDRAVMIRRKYGSLGGHVIIALLTIWWTLGIGNLVYLAYKYFLDCDKMVLRGEPAGTRYDTDDGDDVSAGDDADLGDASSA